MSGKSEKPDRLEERDRVRLKDGRVGTVVYVSEDRQSGIVEFDVGEYRPEDYDYDPETVRPEELDDTDLTLDIALEEVEEVLR
jgi:hypothetical protein